LSPAAGTVELEPEQVAPDEDRQLFAVSKVELEQPNQYHVSWATMTTFAAGEAGDVSLLVATEKLVFVYVAAAGFVMPAMLTTLAPPALAAHVPPLFASVIVTVATDVDPVAEQFVNPLVSAIVGVAGMPLENVLSKVTVMVSPAANAPVLVVVNPTAQLATIPVTWGVPVKVTPVTAPAAITTAPAGDPVAASDDVFTENEPGPYEPCAGFVIPEIVT
jgi:hypothetical protein